MPNGCAGVTEHTLRARIAAGVSKCPRRAPAACMCTKLRLAPGHVRVALRGAGKVTGCLSAIPDRGYRRAWATHVGLPAGLAAALAAGRLAATAVCAGQHTAADVVPLDHHDHREADVDDGGRSTSAPLQRAGR